MRTNLSQETVELLRVAKKASLGIMEPLITEELIFLAIIKAQHPLWLIIKHRFDIDENRAKNLITNFLLEYHPDDPSQPKNKKQQEAYFDRAHQEACKDAGYLIEPYHLVKAFCRQDYSGVTKVFAALHVKPAHVAEELAKISYSDLAKIVDNTRPRNVISSSQVVRATESYSTATANTGIAHFGRNLNMLAREGKLDDVYFRDDEIQTVLEILCRKHQNNPLLVGDAGVGKTAIAEGIARLIVAGNVPEIIKTSEIIELNITALVAGTTLRGQFEDRIQKVIEECERHPRIILFIDEIHMIVGAGGERGLSDAANIFKPALARGKLRCVGATTGKEYHQYIEHDKALKRRFQAVAVKEPTPEQTMEILRKSQGRFELFHGVTITPEAVEKAVQYADDFIPDKHFPGKAFDILDHACAREKIDPASDKIVTPEEVAAIVAKLCQMPITRILGGRQQELSLLAQRLQQRVIGQEKAVADLVELIQLIKMGLFVDPVKPEGVVLFAGPAGVGKKELVKALAEALLGDESRMVHFDMTEYKDAAGVGRLVGTMQGGEGRLISSVRANPNSIMVMTHLESAHSAVLDILRQIFETGSVTTPDGARALFSRITFVLITTIPEEAFRSVQREGLSYEELCRTIRGVSQESVEQVFVSDFLQVLDKVIYFNPLRPEAFQHIVREKLDLVIRRLAIKSIKVVVTREVENILLEHAMSQEFGAHRINKLIEKIIFKPLSAYLLSCEKNEVIVSRDAQKNIRFFCN